jgi:hypothetical protein
VGIVINGVSKIVVTDTITVTYNYQEQSEKKLGIKECLVVINEFVNLE